MDGRGAAPERGGTVHEHDRDDDRHRTRRGDDRDGDLTVLGNLQVGGEEPAFGDDKAKAGVNVWTTGNVHAFGSMHLGPGEFQASELFTGTCCVYRNFMP